MSKDLPGSGGSGKKNSLKALIHRKRNAENGVNFLNSDVVNKLLPCRQQVDIEYSNGMSANNDETAGIVGKSVPRHLNGIRVHVESGGCKNVLNIHRCLSDGKLTELVDEEESLKARSLSSSDCCANGSHPLDIDNKSNEMAGADSKRLDSVGKSSGNQTKENCGKSKSGNSEKHIQSKVVNSKEEDSNPTANGDIVRPKTWSRKLAEKCKLRKDTAKETGKNTHKACEGKANFNVSKPKTKTCKAFEHDRNLLQQQRASLTNRNSDAQCSVFEIAVPNDTRLDSTSGNVYPIATHTNGEIDVRTDSLASNKSSDESESQACDTSHNRNTDVQDLVIAPLAEPENVSDDEIGACCSSSTRIDSARSSSNSDGKSVVDQTESEYSESNIEFRLSESHSSCDTGAEIRVNQSANIARTDPNIAFAVYPESIFSRAPDEDDTSVSFGYSSPLSHTVSGASPCDTVTLVERQSPSRNDTMNAVAQNLQQVSSSSLDSLEEIGDYIETDLPPNRLAFFSRGSSSSTTTEEDEGCGDEVLPNNDEESDNETIDPLNSYHNPGLPNLPDVQYNNQPLSFSMNLNSDICQNPTFPNNSWGLNFPGNISARSRLTKSAQSCDSEVDDGLDSYTGRNLQNHTSESLNLPTFSRTSNVNECSQGIDSRLVKIEELLGNANRPSRKEDIESTCRNLDESAIISGESNESSSQLNGLGEVPRLSSSDSDPGGMMLFISDDSENVSPEFESGMQYVFPSIGMSASFSGATDGTYSRQQSNIVFGDPSVNPRNHTSSLDFDRDDEILHYPFFVRRARSLDQDMDTRCRVQNRLSDFDSPNIPVASSNLQHDESNQNKKVFEKSPFEMIAPLPTWDSSDEDENNRVPDMEPTEEEPLDQIFESMENQLTQRQGETLNHLSAEFSASNISVPDEEPIYEEIDHLMVLMDEICSEGEPDNLQPVCNAISKLRRRRRHRSPVSDVEKVMIWNEYEAYVVQVKQIGTSACGPTAVLNVLKAFDFQVEKEEVCQTITSNMRMEAAPIPYYLFSRSTAGTTAQALVEGVASVTRGAIKGRFFHFYPQRDIELTKWLGQWMKKGAVPVATLNLQRGVKPGWTIPDAWHHQMVYGVSSKGVYLTNPLEIVPENVIMDQLTSDSVLLVRRHDVVSRFRDWCPLNEILKQRDVRWRTMNVLGQVIHMLRESMVPQEQIPGVRAQFTSHISIPAVYKAGIILFMRANTDTYEELLKAPELPLKETDNTRPS